MQAVVFEKYGPPDVLRIGDVPDPEPGINDLLVRVHATTITPGDCEIRVFKFPALFWLPMRLAFGVFKPRFQILGQEFAGEVVRVGSAVQGFKPGDRVFGPAPFFGAYAELLCVPWSSSVAKIPANLSFGEAAVVPAGGLNALYFVRKAKLQAGEHILVNGAAGNIGAYAVQLAKTSGVEVTAVDAGPKLAAVRQLGADHCIDYETEDFRENGEKYDVIFDVTTRISYLGCLGSLKKGGRFVAATPALTDMIAGVCLSVFNGRKAVTGIAPYKRVDLKILAKRVEAGDLTPLVDKHFTFETVADGHRYVESGQKIGNVVLDVPATATCRIENISGKR